MAGTNVVSFGISASKPALKDVLGFSIRRRDQATDHWEWLKGYKVFRSLITNPTPTTTVSTKDHPVQSLVWDDFYVEPGQSYDYELHPFKERRQRQIWRHCRPR